MNLNKYNKINLKTKTQILVSFYLLFAVLSVYFYIIPTIEAIKVKKADIFTEKIEQEKKINREKNYANLESEIKKIEPQLGILENVYINANRKLEFITTLEGVAADAKVEQKLTLDLKFNSDGEIKEVPVIIDVSGLYPAIMDYLIKLETASYYININSFDLSLSSTPKEEGKLKQYRLRLNANTYWK
ncbi:MAG: hypothetical protein U9Q85_00260 [Patescibacteria group bacterium]|nr:hypothetical protein [Patescibacteria group bacterium]